MNICMDFQPAVTQRSGIGRYTLELARHLGQITDDHKLKLFYFDFARKSAAFNLPGARAAPFRLLPGRLVRLAWKKISFPPFDLLAGAADIYHFPNFILPPLKKGRTVITVHDISFKHFPQFAENANLKWLNTNFERSLNQTDAIITDSHFVAKEITANFSVSADKVFPVHLGLSRHISDYDELSNQAFCEKFGLDKPYILMVGTLEPRKNYPFLINVFERMTEFDGYLVIAGARGWKYEAIFESMKNSGRSSEIKYMNNINDNELARLYQNASLFMFPSFYEGFGFTPLEAMQYSTPVITSSGGSLPEILGDAAIIINGFNSDEWAEKAMGLLNNSGLVNNLQNKAKNLVAQYTWENTAVKTFDVYKKVLQ
jgi:glycosyltransferase involved in cell wall biosynthesis